MTTVCTADNRAHCVPRFTARRLAAVIVATLAACRDAAPPPCPDLARDLRAIDDAPPGRDQIERVDAALAAARAGCADPRRTVDEARISHQLARARLSDQTPAVAISELASFGHVAIAIRRAELLDRAGSAAAARAALSPALALDAQAHAQHQLLSLSIAIRDRRHADVAILIASAPITDRSRLAHRAAADAAPAELATLALAGGAELASAVADRIEQARGPAAARDAREHAVALEPDVAETWDALARARIADGAIDDALAAWDRAASIAPAQPSYRTTPIQALVIAGLPDRARARAASLARAARDAANVELLVTASAGAAAASDRALAVALARDARRLRPTDGRLAFLLAQRHAEAGTTGEAAAIYVELLACGAHGRPWHRHEVAARLAALERTAMLAALEAPRTCEVVEPADLASYVDKLRAPVP